MCKHYYISIQQRSIIGFMFAATSLNSELCPTSVFMILKIIALRRKRRYIKKKIFSLFIIVLQTKDFVFGVEMVLSYNRVHLIELNIIIY